MKQSLQVFALVALMAALFTATGCSKLQARDQLNKGVQSFKGQKYEEAARLRVSEKRLLEDLEKAKTESYNII